MRNEYEKIRFCLHINKVMENIDDRNVARVKKCTTYYQKVLPLK